MNNCIILGKGARPLVTIPGLSPNKIPNDSALSGAFRPLLEDFKIYLIDRPETLPPKVSNEYLSDNVCQVMENEGIAKADVIGVSQGGMIAQYLASRHPEKVNKLVLGSTMAEPNEMSEKTISNWISLCRNKEYESLYRDIYSHIYSEPYYKKYEQAIEMLCKNQKPDNDDSFIALATAAKEGGLPECNLKIKCPVFVIGSDNDKVLTGKASQDLAARLGCKLYMFEKEGHACYDESQEFYLMCRDFFLK